MLSLSITHSALKLLDGLPAKQYKQLAAAVFSLLAQPLPHDSCPLKGALRGERRLDVGEYRIIYCATATAIDILVIGKRNDNAVYKAWNRGRAT